jgi:hypothetical protein
MDPVDLGAGLELRWVVVDDLVEQDENARTMPPGMFERLQETIGRDGRLEQLPFCAETDRGVEIVSGHHRIRAARAAKLPGLPVIVDVTGLSRSQIRGKQLAHNSISGYDDPDMLARIYQQIEEVESRLESYVDEAKMLEPLEPVAAPGLSLSLDHRIAAIAFLPHQQRQFRKAVDALIEVLDADEVWMAHLKQVEEFRRVVADMGKSYDVRALGPVFGKMAEIVFEHLNVPDDKVADREAWRPLVDLAGGKTAMVPPDAAAVIEEMVDKVRKQTKNKGMKLWQALELVAADYLAGP